MAVVYGHTEQARAAKAKSLLEPCEALRLTLTQAHYPSWLMPLHEACSQYVKNPGASGNNLATVITKHFANIGPIDLPTDEEDPYDLDSLFDQVRDQQRLPELFDKVIDLMKRIIDSQAIDSLAILNSLKQLLKLLQANRTASYAAMFQSFSFAKLWLRKFLFKLVKRIFGVGEAVEALEEAIDETEKAFEQSERDVERLMVGEILTRFPILSQPADVVVSEGYRQLPAPSETTNSAEGSQPESKPDSGGPAS